MQDMTDVAFVDEGNDRERVFRAAMRHSRMVRIFRGAIPVSLIGILASIAAIAFFKPQRLINASIDPGKVVLSGSKINMEAPKLGGFTRDGRPYELTASAAAQDLTNPTLLELKDVHAKLTMQDKSTVTLTAATGLYDTKGDTMMLRTNVVVTSTSGYSVRLQEAQFDTKTNRIVSDKPVEVTMSSGIVKANRLEVSDNGDTMRFEGDVDVNLVPPPGSPPAQAAAASGPAAGQKSGQ
jgi:lipopolysaccharide export system protein LptC